MKCEECGKKLLREDRFICDECIANSTFVINNSNYGRKDEIGKVVIYYDCIENIVDSQLSEYEKKVSEKLYKNSNMIYTIAAILSGLFSFLLSYIIFKNIILSIVVTIVCILISLIGVFIYKKLLVKVEKTRFELVKTFNNKDKFDSYIKKILEKLSYEYDNNYEFAWVYDKENFIKYINYKLEDNKIVLDMWGQSIRFCKYTYNPEYDIKGSFLNDYNYLVAYINNYNDEIDIDNINF